jgi:HEPN domain-containing protein
MHAARGEHNGQRGNMRGLDPITRAEFRQLSETRLTEAATLLGNGHYAGAYYLAGYAVECALKACICKQRQQDQFPPKVSVVARMYSHDLSGLLDLAGLGAATDIAGNTDATLNTFWTIAKDWSEESRYAFPSQAEAEQLYTAVADPVHGVLMWLRQYW